MRLKLILLSILLFPLASLQGQPSSRKISNLISNGDTAALRAKLKAGLDVNTVYRKGVTLLHIAAEYEQYEIVKLLVDKGVKLNIQDSEKRTPLHIATSFYFRNDSIAEYLINKGADVNIVGENGTTALRNTIRIGTHSPNIRIFKLLVEKGADVNYSCSTCCDITPLMLSCSWGVPELVRVVLEKNVPVNQVDCKGRSALIWAVHFNDIEAVKQLLTAGADVHIRDNEQKSVMDYAREEKNEAILKLLNQK